MQSFLEKVAAHIHAKYPTQLSNICIVLPNRRAKLFLKEYLAKNINAPIWIPEMLSIEDFIRKISNTEVISSTQLNFQFYEVYKKIEKEKASTFDEFSSWAGTLLQDFNEIDSYLADSRQLFSYLHETRIIDVWTPVGSAPSDFQKQYLKFFESLGTYYSAFTKHLIENKLSYQGLAYRMASEKTEEKVNKEGWHKIVFAGFNALNAAEDKIIQCLINADMAEIIWDTDVYYTSNFEQEAGKFIRSHKSKLAYSNTEFNWEENLLQTDKKNIQIIGVAQNVGQAKLAGNIIEQVREKNNDLTKTALVLADENLLVPVLNSLPSSVENINITMGYSLRNTPLFTLTDTIFSLYENTRTQNNDELLFYHKNIIKFLGHPYIISLLGNNEQGVPISMMVSKDIADNNRVYISRKSFQSLLNYFAEGCYEKTALVFEQNEITLIVSSIINPLTLILKEHFILKGIEKHTLELEYCHQFSLIATQLQTLIEQHSLTLEIKTQHALFNQAIRSQTLSFYGEPLKGLQIMGMLETRTLDFETVVLLSANEDILPAGKKENSFIPYEIKRNFGLPTYSDKDAIFAYHFYRLLQRAKNVYLLYNTETDEFGSGEKSRFITQLIEELPKVNKNITITEQLFSIPLNASPSDSISYLKTEKVVGKLQEIATSGFSPSSLNTYRNCSLQFYYRHIARLKEVDEVEESVDAATFGNIVHQILENFYTPIINVPLTKELLQKMLSQLEEQTDEAFKQHYKNSDIHKGKNLLTLNIIKKLVKDFLNQEVKLISELAAEKKLLTILKLEEELYSSVEIQGLNVKVKGKTDRIDSITGTIRVIDYKTGNVESKELKMDSIDDLEGKTSLNKSFQLLLYAYLYKKSYPNDSRSIYPSIISFRNIKSGAQMLSIDNNKGEVSNSFLEEFESHLKNLLSGIFNTEIPFSQTADKKICLYCPYKKLCNR